MEVIGQIIIFIMMGFLLIGAVCAIFDDEKGFGREFKEGIYAIGPIFLPTWSRSSSSFSTEPSRPPLSVT